MANAFDVHIRKEDLAAFRRRVLYHYKQKPGHEYMEVIFIRKGVGEYHIESFHKIKITDTSPYHVDYDDEQYQAYKREAKDLGLEYGSIHTHTVSDTSPSVHDHCSAAAEGDALVGIMEIDKPATGKLKTKLDFWIPQLPCKINQIRS